MTKVSKRTIEIADFGYYVNNLWSAFTLADSKEQIRLLFKDLFTHTEYTMFAKRLEVARRLLNSQSYEQIQEELKVTSQTIAKINNILADKGEGLRTVCTKLENILHKQVERNKQHQHNLANPFEKKLHRKTVLGAVIAQGVKSLDKKITQKLKQRSAKKNLEL